MGDHHATASRTSRTIGLLLIVQLAGFIVPFVLLLPLGREFLATAAPASAAIRTAVVLLFANGALTMFLSLLVARVVRAGDDTGPPWLMAAGLLMCTLQAVDNAGVLAMLTFSDRFVNAMPPDEALRVGGDATRALRQWTHTIAILAIDVWIASLYLLLHRREAVPRALTALGLATTVLHFVGIPLRTVLGYAPLAAMGMPMALGHLALATWLIVKGVPDVRQAPVVEH